MAITKIQLQTKIIIILIVVVSSGQGRRFVGGKVRKAGPGIMGRAEMGSENEKSFLEDQAEEGAERQPVCCLIRHSRSRSIATS